MRLFNSYLSTFNIEAKFMNQTFFAIKFEDEVIIDYDMFRQINEIIAKIRYEGYGRILAPRYEYYGDDGIVNDLGNKMYLTLYIMHGDGVKLKTMLNKELDSLGYVCSWNLQMPDFIEIFYNASRFDNPIKFENEFKTKIMQCGGVISQRSDLKSNYDCAVTFQLQCQMDNFDEKIDDILDFLEKNVGKDYFIEYI